MKNRLKIKTKKLKLTTLAFTLIELLAVIIVIGLLAVLIIPKVKSTIEDSRRNSSELSAHALLRTSTNYYLEKRAQNNDFSECTYNFDTNSNSCTGLEFKGEAPTAGTLTISSKGEVTGCLVIDGYTQRIYNDQVTQEEGDCSSFTVNTNGTTVTVAPKDTGDGLYKSDTEEGEYIYKGSNPNNYIWLDENGDSSKTNEEIYRIISFEEDGTIKVIRNNSIGYYPWDWIDETTGEIRNNSNNTYCQYSENSALYYGCHVWANQTNTYLQNTLLNNEFYYKYYPDNTSSLSDSRKGTVTQDTSLNVFLNNDWINSLSSINSYIAEHTFNVGGLSYGTVEKDFTREKEEIELQTWQGKVGLVEITELVETTTNNNCTNVYSNFYYNSNYYYDTNNDGTKEQHNTTWPCSVNNWLFKSGWTISSNPDSDGSLVWYISNQGFFSSDNHAYFADEVRPVFYLKSSIILEGSGTESDPYRIIQ